jgi:HlyD family secretion protein
MAGLAILFVCVAGFGLWAATAPLEGAVVATGSFVANGVNKQVQHLEGGIIRSVFVKEGDVVEAGDVVAMLDDTSAAAKLRRLIQRERRLLASRARLEAQINDREAFEVPAALTGGDASAEVASILTRQQAELTGLRQKMAAEQDVLRKEIAGLEEVIRGYRTQLGAASERLSLFQEEARDKSVLFEKQLIKKTDMFNVRRLESGAASEVAELTTRIADASEKIARANQQITSLQTTALQKAIEELRTTETELDDVQEQVRAARDVVERTAVHAPVKGAVVKLNYHTQGGVVAAGGVILELLPLEDELVIEARIKPTDITYVKEGQEALIRLSALNARTTPMVSGVVIYLSADTVAEQQGTLASAERRSGSFVVRIRLSARELQDKVPNFRPIPGMPADVYIKTARRTFYEYMMQPVFDSFSKAFREH